MTLIAAIASQNGFRLIGDKRTVDTADRTGQTYTDTTRKIFYSPKHHIGIGIAGNAELSIEDLSTGTDVSLGMVGDIIQNFLDELEKKDPVVFAQRLNVEDMRMIYRMITDHIAVYPNGQAYQYAFLTGVDLVLAGFVAHQPVLASQRFTYAGHWDWP